MVSVVGELSVMALFIIAVGTWPLTRMSNSSGFQSSGSTHHSQGTTFISELTQVNINTPSPRSLPGGAPDQTLVFDNRQHDPNRQIDTEQEFKDNTGSQRNPYHVNIRESSSSYQINFSNEPNSYGVVPQSQRQHTDTRNLQMTQTASKDLANVHHPTKNPVQHNTNFNNDHVGTVFDQDNINEHGASVDRKDIFGIPKIDNDSIVPADSSQAQEHSQLSQSSQERFYRDRFPSFTSPGDMLSVLAIGVRSAAQDDDDYTGGNYSERQHNFNHVSKPYIKGENSSAFSSRDQLPGLELSRNYSYGQNSYNAHLTTKFPMSQIPTLASPDGSERSYQTGSIMLSNGGALIVNKSLEENRASIEPRLIEVPKSFPFEEVLYTHDHVSSVPVITPEARIVTPNSYNYHSTYKVNTTHQDPDSSGSKIVFPGEMQTSADLKFRPEINGRRPQCADDNSFCESVDQYPHAYVKSLLDNSASLGSGFQDFVPIPVDTRIQPEEQVFLCPSSEQVVYPKMAQNKDDKWLFVVNQDSYVQGVRIEKCERQETCSFSENFANIYVTSCQQKYIYRKLLALGEDGNPTSDTFRLPSCCSCVLTKKFPTGRMGTAGKPRADTSRKRRR